MMPDSEYQVVVYALNGVSDQTDGRQGRDVIFRTEAASKLGFLHLFKCRLLYENLNFGLCLITESTHEFY